MTIKTAAFLALCGPLAGFLADARPAGAFGPPDEPAAKAEPPRDDDSGRLAIARSAIAQALVAAESVDSSLKGALLANIAGVQARLGDRAGAEATFQKAKKALEDKPPIPFFTAEEFQISTTYLLAFARFEAGDRVQAEALARRAFDEARALPERDSKGRRPKQILLYGMSYGLATAGRGDLAIEAATAIDNDCTKALALVRLGRELVRRGDLKDAARAIGLADRAAEPAETKPSPPIPWRLDWMRRDMAEGLAELAAALGDFGNKEADRAGVWAARTPPNLRPQAVARVAMARRKLGDEPAALEGFARAFQLLADATPPRYRPPSDNVQGKGPTPWADPVEQLAWIAKAQIDSGDRDGGLETLRRADAIHQADGRQGTLRPGVLVEAWESAGEWAECLKVIDTSPGSGPASFHLESIARRQAEAGEAAEALAWAAARAKPLDRAHALLGVARGVMAREKGR